MNVKKKKKICGVFLRHITGPLASVLRRVLLLNYFLYYLHKLTARVKQKGELYSHVSISDAPSAALQLFNHLDGNWLQS